MTVHDRLQTIAAICIAAVAASAATAVATVHTLAVSNAAASTGSEGALTYNNTSANGATIEGTVSNTGDTTIKLPFALIGEYLASSTTFGIGTGGVSTSGYGVGAEALGPNPALYAIGSGSGGGGQIVSTGSGIGLEVTSSKNVAADISTTGSSAALEADGASSYGIYAASQKNDAGVFSAAGGGLAYLGLSNGTGVEAEGIVANGGPALVARQLGSGADSIDAYNSNGGLALAISDQTSSSYYHGSDSTFYGNVYSFGSYYACTISNGEGFCNTAGTDSVTRSRAGNELRTYAPHQSEPTVEDFGEARLANGSSYVRLDPAFAGSISAASNYLVFLTPGGDSRGLYVTGRSANGFEVHENGGGRSTLSFSYRIVAKPVGAQAARFQNALPVRAPFQSARARTAALAEFAHLDASRKTLPAHKPFAVRHLITR